MTVEFYTDDTRFGVVAWVAVFNWKIDAFAINIAAIRITLVVSFEAGIFTQYECRGVLLTPVIPAGVFDWYADELLAYEWPADGLSAYL